MPSTVPTVDFEWDQAKRVASAYLRSEGATNVEDTYKQKFEATPSEPADEAKDRARE